ncbi:hypothetical protein MYX75_09660 [Acidobacteria bacterium AH-259-A15]|nr:hypothetical protein [Acidobacteria bacterium AH-259-A15]
MKFRRFIGFCPIVFAALEPKESGKRAQQRDGYIAGRRRNQEVKVLDGAALIGSA